MDCLKCRKRRVKCCIVCVSGSCRCCIEDRSYDVKAYDLLFIPADQYYSLETSEHCEYCFACFYCDLAVAKEADCNISILELPKPETRFFLPYLAHESDYDRICVEECLTLDDAAYSNLLALFTKAQISYSPENYLDRLLVEVSFQELLLLAAKAALKQAEQTEKYPRTLEKMMRYIQQNYTETITPETLSELFFISKEHICFLFAENLKMSVSRYVNTVKMNHAIELLSNSSMNVSQIAEYLGYSSVYYFSRVFKQFCGVSPSKYL